MTDDNPYSQLISLLEKLSFELKVAQLWSEQVPSAFQLQSSQPFCCDTLTFEQWLQFIFITRLSAMAKQKQALPQNILVSPMAEEVFSDPKQHVVIDTIADIDELLSGTKISRTWHVKNVNSAS